MTLNVTPGVNVLVEIAIDQLNRILTPFPNPQVRTVSEASTSVDGSAIYVATASETPVTLFISDASDPNHALSLTLAPRRIPPRELRLVLTDPLPSPSADRRAAAPAGGARAGVCASASPRRCAPWRARRSPRATACARRDAGRNRRPASSCGLETRRGQVLEGRDLWLVTALARNTTDAATGDRGARLPGAISTGETVAVAAWPRVWLAPGEHGGALCGGAPDAPEQRHPARPSLRRRGSDARCRSPWMRPGSGCRRICAAGW